MGFLWDLFQQSQISEQDKRSSGIDERVVRLEEELKKTQLLLRDVIGRLEERIGGDLDGDDKLGG
jgi:hypothetical protein